MKKKIPFFLSIFVVAAVLISPFTIKVQVDCQSQFGECPPEISAKLQRFNSKSLFQARLQTQNLLKNEFLISDFSTQFQIPNILKVNILVKKPIFAILDKNSGNGGLIDNKGQILVISKNISLPNIVTAKDLKVGQFVTDEELFALKLIQGIFEMYQIQSGEIADGSLAVELPGQVRVIFPLTGDVQVLLGETRLTYGKVESADLAGKYSEIDLRFKNPVLR